ncbi:tripartite ATP-independent transporter solute receptor, DctP family [Ruminococcus sp. YE71]|uniref:TRAP transporter substrate-binding protein n=1 Tax=unclassified Ruminococcus TaxID=2608920 RepID=UPI0008927445|nr:MULTISPECIES: TRAP transporter substrate-binding protein [unclassified Ruminococcus]SDA20650.1 tripartite ATP-independent transporter solute receptor, DctP family [Ruminococcus sp. YE78]SFW33864.1 tripartite ATP-independent transporter solute receptor, DctP family [Ruminococcus sp. YE71]
MNKKMTALLLSVSLLLMSGCQKDSGSPSSIESDPQTSQVQTKVEYPLTVRVGYSTGADDPRGIALDSFCKTVTEKTNGDILFEIHPSGELGSDSELINGMIEKTVDMTVSSAGNYALYATKIGVSALPFLFSDFESAWTFIDSDVMQALNADLEEYNMHVLAYFDNGFRCVTTSENIGPIEKAEDMDGLNIRTPENQIVMETMSELGANPRSYPFAELKQALTDGVFDAQENPIPVIYNNGLYEVQKYLSVTNHSYDAMPLTIRQDIWEQLSDDYKQVISDAAADAQQLNRSLVKQQTEDCVKELEAKGMIVVYPDLVPFRNATTGVMDMFRTVYGEELIKYISR